MRPACSVCWRAAVVAAVATVVAVDGVVVAVLEVTGLVGSQAVGPGD